MDLREGVSPITPSEVVEFDQLTPTTGGVVFTPNTPATTDVLYVSTVNASTWIYNGSSYVTYTAETLPNTPFYLLGTTIDAGGNKTAAIQHLGPIRATKFTGDGLNITGINAANLGTGTVPTARLGSGTADSTTYLRGDNTWATVSAGGVFGISNSSGIYTYYATWALAMAAATSGQTVELFADISETTNAYILKDGVNVNGNGHTITFTNSDHGITDNNTAVNCKLFNLTIVRSNASGVGYRCLYIDNTSSKVFGCGSLILKNTNSTGLGLYLDGECSGIIIECANGVYGTSSSSNLYNFVVKSFGTGYGVYMISGGSVSNGIIESTSTGNDSLTGNLNGSNIYILSNGYQAVSISAGVLSNSKILSLTSVGATVSGSGKLKNCYVESRGSYAVRSNGLSEDCIDCIFKSTVSYAVSPNNGEYHKCTFVAEANTVTGNWNNKDYFFNCTFISKWNNSGAHCIANFVTGTKAVGCSFIMTNSSAYPVYNSVAVNIYAADCKINGTTNFLHSNVTNIQTNVADTLGNIIIN